MLTLKPTMLNEKLMGVFCDQPYNLTLRLFKNDVTPNNETLLATLEEADQDNYQDTSGLNRFETNPDGKAFLRWYDIEYDAPREQLPNDDDANEPNTLYGIYGVSRYGNNDVLVFAVRFPSAIVLNTPGQELDFEIVWFPNTGLVSIMLIE